jgi:hypothetical protein
MSTTNTQVHTINHTGADGIVRCYCGNPALPLTSKTDTNPNRDFYRCYKDRGEDKQCHFFSEHPSYLVRSICTDCVQSGKTSSKGATHRQPPHQPKLQWLQALRLHSVSERMLPVDCRAQAL